MPCGGMENDFIAKGFKGEFATKRKFLGNAKVPKPLNNPDDTQRVDSCSQKKRQFI
jgi:hypothetical protein